MTPGAAGAAIAVTTGAASSKLPCYPMPSGLCDVTSLTALGNAPTPVGGIAAVATYETKSTAPSSKKYQYWSVKVKPYLETQFSIQNKIYVDQLL